MNNIIKRKWNQNSMVIIEDLQGMAFQAESGGHTFQISGIDGEGNTVALSGTPAGVMLRADGQDVTLTCSVSGGVVSATLPANAYSVPGSFGLTIFLTSDGQKTAIYAAVGTVGKTSSGTVAPPAGSDVVTLVNAIATAVATIPASYTDLMAAVAPTYSSSGLYAVGSYAWHNGILYRCTTPITSGETWNSGHWTLANLGSDLVDLKSAIAQNEKVFSDILIDGVLNVTPHSIAGYLKSDGTITGENQGVVSKITKKIPVRSGYAFWYKGVGKYSAVSALFYTDNEIIGSSQINSSTAYRSITIPANANYVVFASMDQNGNEPVFDVVLYSPYMVASDRNILENSAIGLSYKNIRQNDGLLHNYKPVYSETFTPVIETIRTGVYTTGMAYASASGYSVEGITVVPGEVYEINAIIQYSLSAFAMIDAKGNFVEYYDIPKAEGITDRVQVIKAVVIPHGVSKLIFNRYDADAIECTLKKIVSIEPCIKSDTKIEIRECGTANTDIRIFTGRYLTLSGSLSNDTNGYYTSYIDIETYDILFVDSISKWSAAMGVIYDSSFTKIACIGRSSSSQAIKTYSHYLIDFHEIKKQYSNAKYVRFGGYDDHPLVIYNGIEEGINSVVEFGKSSLYKKVWYAIGDSFTEGDFSSITQPPLQDGLYAGQMPVYPFFIGNRTGMIVHNLAKRGAVLATISDQPDRYQWTADDHYKLVGSDADYITVWIGANDTWQSVPIGTIDSDDVTTFYGAYNTILNYYVNNFPNAKIGIVASFSCTQEFAEATIAIGAKYGIPVLNLYNDPKVPLTVNSKRPDVSSNIIAIRNAQWRVSETNNHPSAKYHEIESYFIEEWLKTL